jgi:hypothetical protein
LHEANIPYQQGFSGALFETADAYPPKALVCANNGALSLGPLAVAGVRMCESSFVLKVMNERRSFVMIARLKYTAIVMPLS